MSTLLVGLSIAPEALLAREPKPYRILPGPYTKKQTPADETPSPSRFTLLGLTVEVENLDAPRRLEFIRSITPGAADPFAPRAGGPERYLTFRVSFENESGFDVIFQSGNVVLITNKSEQRFPIDMSDIYMRAARVANSDPQAVYDRVAPLIFDSSTTIPAGRRRSRLMVFGPIREKWKEFNLRFSFLQIGTETRSLSFTFHKQILKD